MSTRQDASNIKESFDKAYTQSLKFLSYRPRSKKEISDFLIKKGVESFVVIKVIELLSNQNLVNDVEFAVWWIEQRQGNRAKGKILIKQELKQKGISEATIEQTLRQSNDDYKTAHALFEKRKRVFEKYTGLEYKQKTAAFFKRRGFTWDVIKKVLNNEE